MNFVLLPYGSGGFSIEKLLERWFPPRLTLLDKDARKEVLAYQYRITRRGDRSRDIAGCVARFEK